MGMKSLGRRFTIIGVTLFCIFAIVVSVLYVMFSQNTDSVKKKKTMDPELARAMTYEQFGDGSDDVYSADGETKVDNVKFSAFFLRDLDGDGYAEKLMGTCKEINKSDTLYMEVNILSAGKLKNGKIEINGNNFYFQTILPKDQQIKNNVIGMNTKQIEFNDMTNGTQKLLAGFVRAGDNSYNSTRTAAIGNNTNNYSRNDNKVIFTGTYENEEGIETEIRKEVDLTVDWYGKTETKIRQTSQSYYDLPDRKDEENGELNLTFNVETAETAEELILKRNVVEGTIPDLNGYSPIQVTCESSNAELEYDEETHKFVLIRSSEIDEEGNITKGISRNNIYRIKVTYPRESYEAINAETISISIPIEEYYEGYNNQNNEFSNPYKSNIAKGKIVAEYSNPRGSVAIFDITVGKYMYEPTHRYVISKEKPLRIYNEISSEEHNDVYTVKWYGYTGTAGESTGMVMKETKNESSQVTDEFIKADSSTETMEDVTTNVGIAFSNASNLLGDDGWIKVYDEETGILIETFDKGTWSKYSESNPYIYEKPVKHIRIETSATKAENSLTVYNIKELDDEYITENYTREQFDNLKYIKSTLTGYLGENYINTDTHSAVYEAPYSIAKIRLEKNVLSTQETEKNDQIIITAQNIPAYNQIGWLNGSFLVKLPAEIIDAQINNVAISNTNVDIVSYELIDKQDGKYIKINTQNKKDQGQDYVITIDCDLTPDSRIASTTKQIELWASNDLAPDYYYNAEDIYDVNDNLNTQEKVNKTTTSVELVAPNSLLISQTASEFDDENSLIVAPQIADITPQYSTVENDGKTVKLGINLRNNYPNTISEMKLIGVIPFEGNKYVISNQELGSMFTTEMLDEGIQLPEELEGNVTVYYSSTERPTTDIADENNNWKTKEEVQDWSQIKTFMVDFENYVLDASKTVQFSYTVKVPNGVDLNKVTYSETGVYFALDTDEGKYRTQTEPNKLGLRIVEKYNLKQTKYQTGKDKKVAGATYLLTEEGQEEGRTAVTNAQGELEINKLYAEKVYELKEIKSPIEYELSSDIIKFVGHVDEEGTLTIEKLSGETRADITVTTDPTTNTKIANLDTQDEAKAKLKLIKQDSKTEEKIKSARFKITEESLPESGKVITTNVNGEANLSGLKIGAEYTIEETKVAGYYLAEPVKVKIVNNSGNYEAQIVEGEAKQTQVTLDNEIPTINITLEDDKIPTYNLQINKIEKGSITEQNQAGTPVVGAKFRLYKGKDKIADYETDENGHIEIEGLYQYEEQRDIDQTYKLEEIYAPDGYAKTTDIEFYAQMVEEEYEETDEQTGEVTTKTRSKLQLKETDETAHTYTVENDKITLIVEDQPSFRLIKKDGETNQLLPNTKFSIYNVEEGQVPATNSKGEILGEKELINGREYYVLTTDENGQITADLPEGLYKAVEVEADEKYDIENNTEYFGIGKSREGKKATKTEWGATFGGSSSDYIRSVTSTADGGYIAGGYFNGSVTIGGETYTSTGRIDGIIIKYSSTGEEEWAKTYGGSNDDYIRSVASTADGGYIAGGDFLSSSVTIGGETYTSTGRVDGIIIKYSSTGEEEWVKTYGGSNNDRIYSITSTADGGYIAGGEFDSSSVTIGGETYTRKGYDDGIIIKYSSTGEEEWVKTYGGSSDDRINSVASTADGGYIAGGYFLSSSVTIGGETYTSKGNSDGIIIKYSITGEEEWVKTYGGSNSDRIYSITSTADGGYIAGGYFESSVTIGGETYTSKGNSDGIIIKYSSTGEEEWAKTYGGSNNDIINSVTSTADGGYIAGGYFESSSVTIGGETYTSTGRVDGIIIKYSSTGEEEWAKTYGGSSEDIIYSVASTADGGYIAGGEFESSITIGGKTYTSNGSDDGIIIKLKEENVPDPIVKDAKTIGGSSADGIRSVASTADGGYIAGGDFNGSVTIGGETYTSRSDDGIIIKYNSAGEEEWVKTYGGSSIDHISSVASTADGGYIAGGYFYSSSVTIGGETYTSKGDYDGIIIKYSSTGEEEWVKTYGGRRDDRINSVASTAEGGYIAGGYFYSSVTIGGETYTSKGNADGIIIKYSSTGEEEWAKTYGGNDLDYISSVASTAEGGYIAGGYFYSSVTIGRETYTSNGREDGIIIKYSSTGEEEWVKTYGGSNDDRIYSVASTAEGGYIAGGYFLSSSVTIGGETYTSTSLDGIIIKYSSTGEEEWAKTYGGSSDDYIRSVASTADGGYIAGGYFYSSSVTIGGKIYTSNGKYDEIIIKYSSTGEEEWVKTYGGSSSDYINSVASTTDGKYIVGGEYNSSTIDLGNNISVSNQGNVDGIILKIDAQMGVPEQQEVTIENYRKQYKITTDVQEIDNIKGGSISGEDAKAYERVKYGDNSTKEIVMTPDENYEIIGIMVNGEEWQYETLEDGSYTMPQFENMTEDKHVVVTYSLKDNKIIINKTDSDSGENLTGAKFKLDQIEERNEPNNSEIIGTLTENGTEYNRTYW